MKFGKLIKTDFLQIPVIVIAGEFENLFNSVIFRAPNDSTYFDFDANTKKIIIPKQGIYKMEMGGHIVLENPSASGLVQFTLGTIGNFEDITHIYAISGIDIWIQDKSAHHIIFKINNDGDNQIFRDNITCFIDNIAVPVNDFPWEEAYYRTIIYKLQ